MIKMFSDKNQAFSKAMKEEARRNPGGWVYQFDWEHLPNDMMENYEIVGAWKVDNKGYLTDEFQKNPNYSPIIEASRPPREYMLRGVDSTKAGNWVVECDPSVDHLFPNFPKENITGLWLVGSDGKFTGQFRPNPAYTGDLEV